MIAGLIGILEIGEKIKAPADVSGVWRPDETFSSSLNNSCASLRVNNPLINIEQSGVYLFISMNDAARTKLHGKIENNKLSAEGTISLKVNNEECRSPAILHMISELQRENGQVYLTGEFSTPECRECSSINFTALKNSFRKTESE